MGYDIKPLTANEMVLALDRISRFKFPEIKLKRVYVETICSHFIHSKGKKSDIENIDYKSMNQMFTEIWNYSIIQNFNSISTDFNLNENFINEEKSCYNMNKQVLELMPDKADFKTLVENIANVPNNFINYKTPKKVVLTEGITEEILLPEFSKVFGYDWNTYHVKIVGTGGKTRIINLYNEYKSQIKVPIYILLDNDAKSVYEDIYPVLRKSDLIHLIKSGEIEDIIPVNLFKKAINNEYKQQSKISVSDFNKEISMVENLHNIYKSNGFGEYKKAKMAQMIKNIIKNSDSITDELKKILNEIKEL